MTANFEEIVVAGDQASAIQERTEIALRVPNELNLLARLFKVLDSQRPDIHAWCFYSDHERAKVLLVTGNSCRIVRALRASGFACETSPIIIVEQEHRSVSPAQLTAELRKVGVNVLDAYTCSSPRNGALFVLKTTNSLKAVERLEAMDRFRPRSPSAATSFKFVMGVEQLEAV